MINANDIIFDYLGANLAGDTTLPHETLRALGVTWESAEAQPIADQIVFRNCQNLPADLPPHFRRGKPAA